MSQDTGHLEDLLDQLEKDALDIDRTGDGAIVHLLFRTAHNLKSSTAQAGFAALSQEVHGLEDALDRVRRGRAPWDATVFDRVTRVVDLARLAIHGEPPAAATAAPAAAPRPAPPPPAPPRRGLDLTPEEEAACAGAEAAGQGLFRLEKLFRKGLSHEAFLALPVLEDLADLGTLIAIRPPWDAFSAGPEEQVVKFLFASPRTSAELAEILFDPLIVLAEPSAPPPPLRTGPLRFLIVEDDPTAGGLLRYILRQHGECLLCETGAAGLEAFGTASDEGRPFDLVILDLFLPDIQGDEVLSGIRAQERRRGRPGPEGRCQVFINTASRELGPMSRALQQEPDGFLGKPINMDFILERIGALRSLRPSPA